MAHTSRSITSLIHQDLKRILVAALSLSALALLIYTVFSFKQAENQAQRFVMGHVERLARGGVSSQDVADIDLEIARFARTWNETEDLGLRIDIFLNDRQISHAGQLQAFGWLSSSSEKELKLPSGDALRVQTQMDLTGIVLYGLLLLFLFEGAILALFSILSRSMQASIRAVTRPLESKVNWIKEIARDLPESARVSSEFHPAGIIEIDDLGQSIGSLIGQIAQLERRLEETNFDRGRVKMAEQVAHSIKGVIATLQLKVSQLPAGSESGRRSLTDCISSLRELSTNLLEAKKRDRTGSFSQSSPVPEPKPEPTHLLPVLTRTVALKAAQYETLPQLSITFLHEDRALGQTVRIKSADLQSALFSLIDNAIESYGPDSASVRARVEIEAQVTADKKAMEITIRDFGQGIPESILPSLTTDGFSYGKAKGNGIGLFHAREIIEAAGGSISIDSRVGVGTSVQLRVPLTREAGGPIQAIQITDGQTLVFVDDDPLVHAVWQMNLDAARLKSSPRVHLNSAQEFEDWVEENGPGEFGSRLYFFDHDLEDPEKRTGQELIARHGLALESILVSGLADDPEIAARSYKMGLRFLSKEHLGRVPIAVERSHAAPALAQVSQEVQCF